MKLKLKFFGRLAELTGADEMMWEAEESLSLTEIEQQLGQRYAQWPEQTYRVAVNQTLTEVTTLNDGDEVAFLPPFAGG